MSVLSVMGLLGVLALAASYFGVAAMQRMAERWRDWDGLFWGGSAASRLWAVWGF